MIAAPEMSEAPDAVRAEPIVHAELVRSQQSRPPKVDALPVGTEHQCARCASVSGFLYCIAPRPEERLLLSCGSLVQCVPLINEHTRLRRSVIKITDDGESVTNPVG
jgi:hypothetical protein